MISSAQRAEDKAAPARIDAGRPEVYLTVDVEPDCPPFLWTWRGIEEGMPRLLEIFAEEEVPGTFFTTGHTAQTHPGCVEAIARAGHEVACHGYSHTSFRTMDRAKARDEIATTNAILRRFAPVTSFRAPYLAFPEAYVAMLGEEGISTDASRAKYKFQEAAFVSANAPIRIAASVTSSVLRLPAIIRDPWLKQLRRPVTLFVHPWEFVDLTATGIRIDCRFRTGEPALKRFRSAIRLFKARGAAFRLVRDYRPPELDATG